MFRTNRGTVDLYRRSAAGGGSEQIVLPNQMLRTAGIQFFAEIELAVLYLIAAAVLLVRPTGLFGKA